ncbi:hypothetical protein HPB51_027984 [Rhipicephalus microplus]|uniref:Uncharacterized protein n=1 Tax=Rhipicephalus microplus TaxID=6941 RepID=A0A9J6CY86_RHIMP|nr:hypothetical protein HPB51_027984 [Rhipicephalus microplus]
MLVRFPQPAALFIVMPGIDEVAEFPGVTGFVDYTHPLSDTENDQNISNPCEPSVSVPDSDTEDALDRMHEGTMVESTFDNDIDGAPLHMLEDATRTSISDTDTEEAMDHLHEAAMVEPMTMTETEKEVSACRTRRNHKAVLINIFCFCKQVRRRNQWTQWKNMMAEDHIYARTVPASNKCKIFAPTLTEADFLFYTGVKADKEFAKAITVEITKRFNICVED